MEWQKMALADRLNYIIQEQKISKKEFAHRVGVTENYIYILTGNSRSDTEKTAKLSGSLARLIAKEFGYNEEWIKHGTGNKKIGDTAL